MEMYCWSVIDKWEILVILVNNIKKMVLVVVWFVVYLIFGLEEERDW